MKLEQLIIQFWEAHSLLPDEIIGEVRINLDAVTNLLDRDEPVRIEELYSFRKRSAQLADLKLAMTFKPSALVLAERASKNAEVRQTVEELRRAEQLGQDGSSARNRLAASRRGVRESGGSNESRSNSHGSAELASPMLQSATPPPQPSSSSSTSNFGYPAPPSAGTTTGVVISVPIAQPIPQHTAANYGYGPAASAALQPSLSNSGSPSHVPNPSPAPLAASSNNYGYDPALIAAMRAKGSTSPVAGQAPLIIVSANTGTFVPASDPSS